MLVSMVVVVLLSSFLLLSLLLSLLWLLLLLSTSDFEVGFEAEVDAFVTACVVCLLCVVVWDSCLLELFSLEIFGFSTEDEL